MPQAAGQDTRASSLSKAKRDARAMPNLVFAVEAWERQLVLAGRVAKVRARDLLACTYREESLGCEWLTCSVTFGLMVTLQVPPPQVNLMRDAKRSTNRDFKLKIALGSDEGSGRCVGCWIILDLW